MINHTRRLTVSVDPTADAWPTEPDTLSMMPGPWAEHAACKGMDIRMFFPERHSGDDGRRARLVCDICTVRSSCLDYAIDNVERFGIWGGMNVNERRHEAWKRRLQG